MVFFACSNFIQYPSPLTWRCLYLSLKTSISPRSSVIASSDNSTSHFSGVLGCFGLGSFSPAPGMISTDVSLTMLIFCLLIMILNRTWKILQEHEYKQWVKMFYWENLFSISSSQIHSWTLQFKCAASVLNKLAFFIQSFEGPQKSCAFHNETWIVLFLPLDSVWPSLSRQVKK